MFCCGKFQRLGCRPKHVSIETSLKWSILWNHYIRQYQNLYHYKCNTYFDIKDFCIKLPRKEIQCYSLQKVSSLIACISYCSDFFCCINMILLLLFYSVSGSCVGGLQNLLGAPSQAGRVSELDEPMPDRQSFHTGDWRLL